MAEGWAAANAPNVHCSVCGNQQQSLQGLKSLACGHPVCWGCSAAPGRPVCTQCTGPMTGDSRPESFAEFNIEMSLNHRQCEEKAGSCSFRGQTTKCQHCSLHLCPEHVRRHGRMVEESAAEDVRKLQEIRQQAAPRLESSESLAAAGEYRLFKELAESNLDAIAQAVRTLDENVRQPIRTYEAHLKKHTQKRDKALAEIDRMLDQLKTALRSGNHEEVLNAQRTLQYMQNTGAYLPAQLECAFKCNLDAETLEGQINAAVSALQGLLELRRSSRTSVAPSERPAAASSSEQLLENRISCLYMSIGTSTTFDGSKVVTFDKPLDVDCYKAQNEPLVLFVAEANEDESRVTVRSYSEPRLDCKEVPLAFFRHQQVITTFQPRRLAVMATRKLIAMTDVRSSQYSRHIFVCNFSGQAGHKVFRIEQAQKLNGIHASGNRIYVCDTVDCSVFIVDYNDSSGRHTRVPCNESVPISVSTCNELWMLVVCGHKINVFSLDSLQPISGIQAETPGARESSIYVRSSSAESSPVAQYRDIVHFANGSFAISTATTLTFHGADMTRMRSIGGADLVAPGIRFVDLMGMCATEQNGKVRIFLCDRNQKQISIIAFDS